MARAKTSFLRIPTDVRNQLRAICKKNGRIMGTMAGEILRSWVEKNQHKFVPAGQRVKRPRKPAAEK